MTKAQDIAKAVNGVFGEGSLLLGNDTQFATRFLKTGVLPIDILLKGGLPAGRFTEIFGDYSSLKSYIALRAIATTQAAGGTAAMVDTEHAYEGDWLAALGGIPDDVMVMRPDYGEQAVQAMQSLIMEHDIDLIVWDSIAATQPKSVHERNPDDTVQPGRLAAMMSEGLRRLNASNRNTAILCLNQTRLNVGMTFGDAETVPGGRAMPFYASYRIRLSKAGKVTDDVKTYDGDKFITTKRQIGQKIKATLMKSKLNKPFRESWFTYDMLTGTIDDRGFLLAQGLEHGLVEVTNARWKLPYWPKAVHGSAKAKDALTEQDIEWLTDSLLADTAVAFPGARETVRSRARRLKPT